MAALTLELPVEHHEPKADNVAEKMQRETQLLLGATEHLCDGIKNAAQEAWDNPERTMKVVAGAAVCAGIIAGIAKNPANLGKLQPTFEGIVKHGGAALLAFDMSTRVADPIINTWQSPDRLESSKLLLGNRLGGALVDYALMGGGAVAGAKYGPSMWNSATKFLPMLAENHG